MSMSERLEATFDGYQDRKGPFIQEINQIPLDIQFSCNQLSGQVII